MLAYLLTQVKFFILSIPSFNYWVAAILNKDTGFLIKIYVLRRMPKSEPRMRSN